MVTPRSRAGTERSTIVSVPSDVAEAVRSSPLDRGDERVVAGSDGVTDAGGRSGARRGHSRPHFGRTFTRKPNVVRLGFRRSCEPLTHAGRIVNSAAGGQSPLFRFHVRGTVVACAKREIGVSSPMNTFERFSQRADRLKVSDRPVMVNDWAESLVDLEWARSRRRHLNNRESVWAKDGGDDSTQWDI